eukprot:gene19296-25156_t
MRIIKSFEFIAILAVILNIYLIESLSLTLFDSIKDKIRLSDVISNYVTIKSTGRQTFKGLCPFHDDNNPSLSISDDKGLYHCFSCGAGGNVISFVRNIDQLSFRDAIKKIEELTGVELPNDFIQNENQDAREKLYEILEKASLFYLDNLMNSPKAGQARSYLRDRGLSPSTVYRFSVGYASDGYVNFEDTATGNLTRQGYSVDDLIAAGITIAKSDSALESYKQQLLGNNFSRPLDVYDRFRDRVMIPIRDVQGRVIGFGGRILEKTHVHVTNRSIAKYLNSPESVLFRKGHELFGLDIAKRSSSDRLVIVEGYFDVIALHDNGVSYSVASLGTALTKEQLELAIKFSKQKSVVIMFDNDDAGLDAVRRLCYQTMSQLKDCDNADIRIASLSQADAICSSLGIEINESIDIKDTSDLAEKLENPSQLADVMSTLISRAKHWRHWVVDDIVTAHNVKGENELDLSRPIKLIVDFIKLAPTPADRTVLCYYAAERLSGGRVNMKLRLEQDLAMMINGATSNLVTTNNLAIVDVIESEVLTTSLTDSNVLESKAVDSKRDHFVDVIDDSIVKTNKRDAKNKNEMKAYVNSKPYGSSQSTESKSKGKKAKVDAIWQPIDEVNDRDFAVGSNVFNVQHRRVYESEILILSSYCHLVSLRDDIIASTNRIIQSKESSGRRCDHIWSYPSHEFVWMILTNRITIQRSKSKQSTNQLKDLLESTLMKLQSNENELAVDKLGSLDRSACVRTIQRILDGREIADRTVDSLRFAVQIKVLEQFVDIRDKISAISTSNPTDNKPSRLNEYNNREAQIRALINHHEGLLAVLRSEVELLTNDFEKIYNDDSRRVSFASKVKKEETTSTVNELTALSAILSTENLDSKVNNSTTSNPYVFDFSPDEEKDRILAEGEIHPMEIYLQRSEESSGLGDIYDDNYNNPMDKLYSNKRSEYTTALDDNEQQEERQRKQKEFRNNKRKYE